MKVVKFLDYLLNKETEIFFNAQIKCLLNGLEERLFNVRKNCLAMDLMLENLLTMYFSKHFYCVCNVLLLERLPPSTTRLELGVTPLVRIPEISSSIHDPRTNILSRVFPSYPQRIHQNVCRIVIIPILNHVLTKFSRLVAITYKQLKYSLS